MGTKSDRRCTGAPFVCGRKVLGKDDFTVTEILESIMLMCFGLSWPMSLIKNIKAKSAKNMSLPFILLICFGYIAGITAKLMLHSSGYVLIVYVINLIIVAANAVVYVINRRYDKKEYLNFQREDIRVGSFAVNRKVVSK